MDFERFLRVRVAMIVPRYIFILLLRICERCTRSLNIPSGDRGC